MIIRCITLILLLSILEPCFGQELIQSSWGDGYSVYWAIDEDKLGGDLRITLLGEVPSEVTEKIVASLSDIPDIQVEISVSFCS